MAKKKEGEEGAAPAGDEKTKVAFSGKRYRGHDPVTGKDIVVYGGAVVEVSAKKAEQLKADFPKEWADADEAAEVQNGDPAKYGFASAPAKKGGVNAVGKK